MDSDVYIRLSLNFHDQNLSKNFGKVRWIGSRFSGRSDELPEKNQVRPGKNFHAESGKKDLLWRNHFEIRTLPGAPFALVEGGRAVYLQCEQTDVIRVSTLGNFPPNRLVTGNKVSKYTARPPQCPTDSRAGCVQIYEVNERVVLAPWGRGVTWVRTR